VPQSRTGQPLPSSTVTPPRLDWRRAVDLVGCLISGVCVCCSTSSSAGSRRALVGPHHPLILHAESTVYLTAAPLTRGAVAVMPEELCQVRRASSCRSSTAVVAWVGLSTCGSTLGWHLGIPVLTRGRRARVRRGCQCVPVSPIGRTSHTRDVAYTVMRRPVITRSGTRTATLCLPGAHGSTRVLITASS
jgi:hypothetical protein